jgi:hypothetical protein
MEYTEKIINITTGEEIIRPYTTAEIAEVDKAVAEIEANAKIEAEKAIEKAALLVKLGITAEEAKLLLS